MPAVDLTNTELCLPSCEDSVSSLGSTDSFDDDSDTESTTSTSISEELEQEEDMHERIHRHRRNLTAPDLTLPHFSRARKSRSPAKTPQMNSRWGEPALVRCMTEIPVPVTIKPRTFRKTKSVDEPDVTGERCSRDRWTASPSEQQKPQDSSEEEGSRWSSITELRRSSTSDSIPRVPRHSGSESNSNARWSAGQKLSHPMVSSTCRQKRDSAPEICRRSPNQEVKGEANARWSSSQRRGTSYSPMRGINRWNSSSSFKTTNSMASIDQWSTKPIPRRRRRSGQGKKKSGEEKTIKRETLEPELQADASKPPKTAKEVEEPTVEGTEAAEAEAATEEEEPQEVSEPDYEEEKLDEFHTSFRYSTGACLECFETIMEEGNEDEGLSVSMANRSSHDSTLKAPRRRQSQASLLIDESELSTSLSISFSGTSAQDSSCRRRGSQDHKHECQGPCRRRGSQDSNPGECPHQQGLKKPNRRESISNTSCCSHSSNDSRGEGVCECQNLPNHKRWVPVDEQRCHPLLDEKHPLIKTSSKIHNSNCPAA